MPKADETTLIPFKEQLYNIYRVRKARPFDDDATRVVEVHTIDLTKKQNRYTAIEFEHGWHVLGYIPNLASHKQIQEMINKWEKRRK